MLTTSRPVYMLRAEFVSRSLAEFESPVGVGSTLSQEYVLPYTVCTYVYHRGNLGSATTRPDTYYYHFWGSLFDRH